LPDASRGAARLQIGKTDFKIRTSDNNARDFERLNDTTMQDQRNLRVA
jgi:hypothetical protein